MFHTLWWTFYYNLLLDTRKQLDWKTRQISLSILFRSFHWFKQRRVSFHNRCINLFPHPLCDVEIRSRKSETFAVKRTLNEPSYCTINWKPNERFFPFRETNALCLI